MYEAHHYRHLLNPFERCLKRGSDITSFWMRQFTRCSFRMTSIFYSGIHTLALVVMAMLAIVSFLNATYVGIGGLVNGFILFIAVSLIIVHIVAIYTKNGIDTILGIDKDFGHDGLPDSIQKQAIDMHLVRNAIKGMDSNMLVSTLGDGSFDQTIERKVKEAQPYVTSSEKGEAISDLLGIAEEHGRFLGNFLLAIEAIVLSSLVIMLVM